MNKINSNLNNTMEAIITEGGFKEFKAFIKGYKSGLNYIINNDLELSTTYNKLVNKAFKEYRIIAKEGFIIKLLDGYLEENKDYDLLAEHLQDIYNQYEVIGINFDLILNEYPNKVV